MSPCKQSAISHCRNIGGRPRPAGCAAAQCSMAKAKPSFVPAVPKAKPTAQSTAGSSGAGTPMPPSALGWSKSAGPAPLGSIMATTRAWRAPNLNLGEAQVVPLDARPNNPKDRLTHTRTMNQLCTSAARTVGQRRQRNKLPFRLDMVTRKMSVMPEGANET
eukprot:CAMPEP_0203905700 /NCGR_PEP_ID=MMETSP0359-20131031/47402_1 /ASSEMBLY_ACC=CAM_ASM_000338 /TAXON_ID=268821 /ORGANISM="Scrippsiella Hangoei, Strain SHTV-5" /LENGTH=161 /DNA_ID=CAMNT_0050830219 /DNA_START=481 /DNA_END=962 /DNA_ORIENTATION=+